jgi:hypothetical protein
MDCHCQPQNILLAKYSPRLQSTLFGSSCSSVHYDGPTLYVSYAFYLLLQLNFSLPTLSFLFLKQTYAFSFILKFFDNMECGLHF